MPSSRRAPGTPTILWLSSLAVVLGASLAACVEDLAGPVVDSNTNLAIQLRIGQELVRFEDLTLDVSVGYLQTPSSGGQAVEVQLTSFTLPVTGSGTVTIPVEVDLAPCLDDNQRVGGTATCPVMLRLTLRRGSVTLDEVSVGPMAVAAGATATVSEPVVLHEVENVALTWPGASVGASGDTLRVGRPLTLTPLPVDASGGPLTGRTAQWSSADPSIASVDPATGVVTPLAPGTTVITAVVGGRTATFTATVYAAAEVLEVLSGAEQYGTPGTIINQPGTIRVTDLSGRPAEAVTVNFVVASGGGQVTGAVQVTDAAGEARPGPWTLGGNAGVNVLEAVVANLPRATLTAHSCAPDPFITDQASHDALLGVTCVEGNLTVQVASILRIDLPDLAEVSNAVMVQGNATLDDIRLPSLSDVGGDFLVTDNPALARIDFGMLSSVAGRLRIERNGLNGVPGYAFALPSLMMVGMDFRFTDNVGPTALDLSALQTATGPLTVAHNALLVQMNFPVLQDGLNGLFIIGNGIGASATAPLTFPSLRSTTFGPLVIQDNASVGSASFPVLENVGGSLNIWANSGMSSLSFPALQTVNQHVSVAINPDLTSFTAPWLATTGLDLGVWSNASLASVSLSMLATVGEDVGITDNPSLASLDLSMLSAVTGFFSIERNGANGVPGYTLALPVLASIGSNVRVTDNMGPTVLNLPMLQSVGGSLFLASNQGLTTITAPNLSGAVAALDVYFNPHLVNVDFSSLQSTTNGLWFLDNGTAAAATAPLTFPAVTSVGFINFFGNMSFTTFDLPLLATLGFSLDVRDNDNLGSLNVPSLQAIGDLLVLVDNPHLVQVDFAALQAFDHTWISTSGTAAGTTAPWTFPALTTIHTDGMVINNNESIGALSFPVLSSMPGGMDIRDNLGLTSIAAASITTIGGTLGINGHPVLSAFSSPALTAVMGLGFSNNTTFCATAVDALAAQVGLAVYNNSGNAGC